MQPHRHRPFHVLVAMIAGACLSAPVLAQAVASEPVLSLAFELRSNKIAVDAKVNGEGPYPFVVDTGAPMTVLDWKVAESLGVLVQSAGEVGGAGEGRVKLGSAPGIRVSIGDLRFQPKKMEIIPLNETLSPAEGRDIIGLIGGDVLERFACEFDFEHSALRLHEPKGYSAPEGMRRLPVSIDGHVLARATVRMAGREAISGRFIIDTGARIAVSLNTHVVREHNLLADDVPHVRTTIGWGIGGPVEHGLARAESLTLGGVTFDAPTVTLSTDTRGVFASTSISGVIGNEVLRRTRLVIDYPREVIYLRPVEEAMKQPFPADATGVFMTAGGEDYRVFRVRTVVPGSPAGEAGVKPGDVIDRIDGGPALRYSLEELRELFLRPGKEYELELLRGAERVRVRVTTRVLV
jgi:predicted aspartyl protease